MEFKLRPVLTDDTAVKTNCTVEICKNEDCINSGESCIIDIPVKGGLFPQDDAIIKTTKKPKKEKQRKPKSLDHRRETSALCPSDIVFFNYSTSESPKVSVNVENTKKV